MGQVSLPCSHNLSTFCTKSSSKAQFRRVNQFMRSRAPKLRHPRRVGSSYLLSGLIKCQACGMSLVGRYAQNGKYAYYVCPSNIKIAKDACETPSINARRFEELVVNKIRANILTESNIRALVKVVDEEMDGLAREQRSGWRPSTTNWRR